MVEINIKNSIVELKKSYLLKVITISMLCLLTFQAYSQDNERSCLSVKRGKFVIKSAEFGDTYIKRTKKYQIESGIDARTGKKYKIKDKVVWVTDCQYKLVSMKLKSNENDIGNNTLTFSIFEVGSDYYRVRLTNGIENFTIDVRVDKR